MATAPKNSPSEDARSLLECPVCVSTFRNPKSLRCGHSVCFECCQQLRTALHVVCPVCRTRTPVPHEGLPTNFALQDLIEHHVTMQGDKKHTCSACDRRYLIDESWICSLCNSALICANCAIKDHRGHDLQMVSDIISRRREELAEWRQRMEGTVREVDARRRQIDANLVRIEQRSIQLNATLRTKLEPRFAEAIQELNTERDQLFKTIHEVDVSDIIGGSSGNGATASQAHSTFENQLNEVPQKLEALKAKQEQILADQRLALEVVQNCNEVLRQMLSTTPKKNPDGRQQQSQDGAGVSGTTTGDGSRGTLGFGIAGRTMASQRGRRFPHPVNERRSFFTPLLTSDGQPDRGRPSMGFDEASTFTRRQMLAPDSSPEEGMVEEESSYFPPLRALNDGPEPIDRDDAIHVADEDAEAVMMEVEPAMAVNATSTPPRSVQANRSAESLMGRPSPRGQSSRRITSAADAVTRATAILDGDMNMSSDEEHDARIFRAFGRGAPPRPARRSAGAGMVSRLLPKGRGRTTLDSTAPPVVGDRSREDLSQPVCRRGPSESIVSDGQQRERRTSGRPQRTNAEDGAGSSGAAASERISVRFSDSSDDDVTDAILFHTFLPAGGRANDKTKH